MSIKKKLFSKSIVSWFFYDWATSIFSSVITTFIFATYFTQKVAVNKIIGTGQWGEAIGIAALIIAIISPIFGAIADHEGRRKPWLLLFTGLIVLGSAALWFVKPSQEYVMLALIAMAVGDIGVEVAMVFYNSMLRDLVSITYIGRISGWSWGFGYFGGLAGLTFVLLVFIDGHIAFLQQDYRSIRIVGPFVALWVLLFSLPLFLFTPDRKKFGVSVSQAVRLGLKQLANTFRSLRKFHNIFIFLIARMIYIDGLNTAFAFGGIYAAGTFDMNINTVIIFGITMNIAAGIGAIAFAWMDDWLGPKSTIIAAISLMLISGIFMISAKSVGLFWGMGLVLSLNVGPIQAASRSMLIHLSPKNLLTEMFGLYAFSGRATAFLAPLILSWLTKAYNSQRVGMSTILIFLLVGMFLLFFVKSSWQHENTVS